MIKIIPILAISLLMLFACSSINENIDEKMAEDTKQILKIFDNVNENGEELSNKDYEVFNSYVGYYQAKLDDGNLSDEENRLFILTKNLTESPDIYTTLESDKERYEALKEDIERVIKDGKL